MSFVAVHSRWIDDSDSSMTCSKPLIRRVRSAGVFLPLWPVAFTGSHGRMRYALSRMRPPCAFTALKAQGAMCAVMRCDTYRAAGAVKRPAFRTSPWGTTDETRQKAGAPWSRTNHGAMTCVLSVVPAKARTR